MERFVLALALVVGVYVAAVRALGQVEKAQLPR